MPKLIFTIGLPASGKSTWAREQVAQDKNTVIVNRDALRRMRGEYWIPPQEDMITLWENECIISALSQGHNVIVDATNLNAKRLDDRVRWIESRDRLFHLKRLDVLFQRFDTDVDECIRRDANRIDAVGRKVIMAMYDKYLKPQPVEYVEEYDLPHCIICDIDGTLAQMHDRSPFEWDKVGQDRINPAVYNIIYLAKQNWIEVFLFSGRDAVCRPQTVDWLNKHEVPYTDLYMRTEGNTEDDRIVKRAMFEDVIRGKFYCDYVLEDRDKMVRMWREELGLSCLQVNYGNF